MLRLFSRAEFSRWYLSLLIPLILVLPAQDTTYASSAPSQSLAVTATILMEAIEDTAVAAGTLPHGNPPELLQSKKYRAGSFDYRAGLDHHAEAEVQLETDLDLRDRPVKANLKLQSYDSRELALEVVDSYNAVLESDKWVPAEDYRTSSTGLYGYYASVATGEGVIGYFTWFEPGRGYKGTAFHTEAIEIGGIWFRIDASVRGHGSFDSETWSNFTSKAGELADLLVVSLAARLENQVEPTPTPEPEPTEEPEEETERQRIARLIAQNLVDYRLIAREFLSSLRNAYFNEADNLMRDIQDARWHVENDFESEREGYRAELAALEAKAESLLARFNSDAEHLWDLLDDIEGQFAGEPEHDELVVALEANRSELKLTELNLALRTGDTEEFDELFREYRTDPNIAPDVLTANAFRRLMTGDIRLALESAKKTLEIEPRNPTATRIVRDLEVEYLKRIRAKLANEKSENVRLFNEKLNGHGEQGKAQFLIDMFGIDDGGATHAIVDIFTTGLSESVQAMAGYYDIVESVASLNIDEATREMAGIQVIESLRKRGYDFDDISTMSVERLKVIFAVEYNRDVPDAQVERLRKNMFAGLQNLDVDSIRRGDRTQYAVDIGTSYFDTEVLQQNKADFVARQFSAIDTFMTFAPSARLGSLAETGYIGKLGLTGEATFGQAMVKASKIEELGRRIYQTKYGAAVLDTAYQYDSATKMIADAIKNRVGDIAYEAGGVALSAAIDKLSKPMKDALKEELRQISDLYLGTDVTVGIETAVGTVTGLFSWAGINSQALQRGAHGVDRLQEVGKSIDKEVKREVAMLGDPAIATAGANTSFTVFKGQANDTTYLANLRDARTRLAQMPRPDAGAREMLEQADEVLEGMQRLAAELRAGNPQAQSLYAALQGTTGAALQRSLARRSVKIVKLQTKLTMIGRLGVKPPTDAQLVQAVAAKISDPFIETGSTGGKIAKDIAIKARLRAVSP